MDYSKSDTAGIVLITGGARSGKSSFAESLADELGQGRVLYIATAQAFDDEMTDRIGRHRRRRPKSWATIEAPSDAQSAVEASGYLEKANAILFDCLTLYVSNLMLSDISDESVLSEVSRLCNAFVSWKRPVIVVTNEVGLGVVPAYEMGRRYRDLAGLANQAVARRAGSVYLTVCGIPVELKRLVNNASRPSKSYEDEETDIDGPTRVEEKAKTLMIQGTSSHVGKSLIVTALCRILSQDGYRVAPFKSQNMALNSAVTPDGLELGRAQAVQAEAAGIEPSVKMNPILIKPTGEMRAQIVVLGRPLADMDAMEYRKSFTARGFEVVKEALGSLMTEYDAVIIEGAGSPAEVNLKDGDIVNMRIAKFAKSPVLLVADVDKGGSIASIVGTLALLEPDERDLVKGLIINKFRGDIRLYDSAVAFIEKHTGKPVLGVLPYLEKLGIDEEDSVSLEPSDRLLSGTCEVTIGVLRLPRISNFTDFQALKPQLGVSLMYIDKPSQLTGIDACIIPGTKNTIEDLDWLRREGFETALSNFSGPIIGICGGYQMLGMSITDGLCTRRGLEMLDIETDFMPHKVTVKVKAITRGGCPSPLFSTGEVLSGYEIHMGCSSLGPDALSLFEVTDDGTSQMHEDGCISPDGRVWGTYLHGVFDNDSFRLRFINSLRERYGLPLLETVGDSAEERRREFDRWANHVRTHLDISRVYDIMELNS